MATSCENKSTQKPIMFSDSEIEAAEQLIQLSSGDSSLEDHHSSNNSCSYSVVQGKQHNNHNNKVDSDGDVESSIAATTTTTTTEVAEDKGFARKKKNRIRYRYIKDLYTVTKPVLEVKAKKKMKYKK